MMLDIHAREDIELLVNTFYAQVRADEVIGSIFNAIIGDDWSAHLPVMYQFWETVLFNKASYKGNVINKHIAIDRQLPLTKAHYDRWLALWEHTLNSLFHGPIANEAKNRANLMMHLIGMKVEMARSGKSIL